MSPPNNIRRKIVVVGNGSAGKSWLLNTFYSGQCPDRYLPPSHYEGYITDQIVDERQYEIALWDTANREDHDRIRPLTYQGAHVVIICFAVDDPDSLFDITERWMVELKHHCPNTPKILVGCKTDLRNDSRAAESLTRMGLAFVTPEEGQAIADSINASKYLECSAKLHVGLEEVFQHAVRASMIKIKKPKRSCIIC